MIKSSFSEKKRALYFVSLSSSSFAKLKTEYFEASKKRVIRDLVK